MNRGWKRCLGFSLVEMMACVSIIGIIAFMAIPSITRMRSDGELNLAITRAEALNLAQSTFIQVKGRTEAAQQWNKAGAKNHEGRYKLLREYMSYAEPTLSQYMPSGYAVTFSESITSMTKAGLTGPTGNILY
ncbi:prepilin-type N-terminal cleavage/methylation domain-containing protein [Prosthecobacter fusiformis]|uniref:Prepilin-type N-terminal cleavage/methylation domain-containing protein n=2 Tax=Prosthecobacter fusiformis TaxID=48464 RepID=A0A4R7S6D0_9BACT|nr:prepilin-type N-terminal cleavage/methylation domain-containing protein [Prosthecobacter fusiformis]